MNDKIYESCQYLTLGLLVGYFGLYAVDWFKTWSKNKNSQAQQNPEKKPLTNV